jgi:uncharacterized lipoprotein YajG
MKTLKPFLAVAPLAVLSLLAACNSQPETITSNDVDPDAASVAAAPKVELPPMMTGSRTYRCKDNSLVYIDFFNNNTAVYKAKKEDTGGTTLTSEGEGKPYTAEGYSVSANSDAIELTARPDPQPPCQKAGGSDPAGLFHCGG